MTRLALVVLAVLSLASFGGAAYANGVMHNSFSAYSPDQLSLLTKALDEAAAGTGPKAEQARISRSILADEQARRKWVWMLLGVGVFGALGAGLTGWLAMSRGNADEESRLLGFLGDPTRRAHDRRGKTPVAPGGGAA